jgi:16S rRNA (guanine966-N2)-methyltransferase
MTRIVGGAAGGRRLAVPAGRDVRPTSDRAREALFGTVGTMIDLAGASVLDLYAGSGAVGLEAVSRGAARAVLVDSDPRATEAARANATALGLAGRVEVVRNRVDRFLATTEAEPFDIAFADPPYAMPDGEVDEMLGHLAAGWLAPGALVVVERSSRGGGPTWPPSLRSIKQRRYGEGTLWYGRRT